jgi:hypothetical protein
MAFNILRRVRILSKKGTLKPRIIVGHSDSPILQTTTVEDNIVSVVVDAGIQTQSDALTGNSYAYIRNGEVARFRKTGHARITLSEGKKHTHRRNHIDADQTQRFTPDI